MQSMGWPFFHSDVTYYDASNGKGHSNYSNQMSNAHWVAFNKYQTILFLPSIFFSLSVPFYLLYDFFLNVWMPISTLGTSSFIYLATIFIFHKFCIYICYIYIFFFFFFCAWIFTWLHFTCGGCGYSDKSVYLFKQIIITF